MINNGLRAGLATASLLALAACGPPATSTHCQSDADCPQPYRCALVDKVCQRSDVPAADAAIADSGGNRDVAPVDAGGHDLQSADRAAVDHAAGNDRATGLDRGRADTAASDGALATDGRLDDAPVADAHVADARGNDAALADHPAGSDSGPCASNPCPLPTVCVPAASGGYECRCNGQLCSSNEQCLADSAGANNFPPRCCLAGASQRNCDSVCISVDTPANCGTCGQVCTANQPCVAGQCGCNGAADCDPATGAGSICCGRTCYPGDQLTAHCGCDPEGLQQARNCTNWFLESQTFIGGFACVTSAGNYATPDTLRYGRCGCLSSGQGECGFHTNATLLTLVGLCNPDSLTCVMQSESSCGMVNGVYSLADHAEHPGATCDPRLGGSRCLDWEAPFQYGECACGTDQDCSGPVIGGGSNSGVTFPASNCGAIDHTCHCGLGGPTCTSGHCCGRSCINPASDRDNCGTCGSSCEASTSSWTQATCTDGACYCDVNAGDSDPTTAACPVLGSGTICQQNKCVCPSYNNTSCPIGMACVPDRPAPGRALGCCFDQGDQIVACLAPAYCAADGPLCVDPGLSQEVCCAAGQHCGRDASGTIMCAP